MPREFLSFNERENKLLMNQIVKSYRIFGALNSTRNQQNSLTNGYLNENRRNSNEWDAFNLQWRNTV